jgi:hypothetical protein
LGTFDSASLLRELYLFRIVSIVEAYLNVLHMEMLGEKLPPPTKALERMIVEVEISSSINWSKRQEAFSRYHQVSLASCDGWTRLQAAREVRNSIAHGLGRLTSIQRSQRNLANKVREIDVTVGDGRMYLSESTVLKVETAGRAFLWSVDERT